MLPDALYQPSLAKQQRIELLVDIFRSKLYEADCKNAQLPCKNERMGILKFETHDIEKPMCEGSEIKEFSEWFDLALKAAHIIVKSPYSPRLLAS